MRKIESFDDLPAEIKLLYSVLPDNQKIRLMNAPWGMGAFAYCFTHEERESIETSIRNGRQKVSEEKVCEFVLNLEGLASQKKYEILDRPKKMDLRAARQEIIDDGNEFLKHLEGIISCRHQWVGYDDLESGDDPIDDEDLLIDGRFNDPVTLIKTKVWGLADKIKEPMQEMIKALDAFQKKESKKVGRERADSDNFIKLIAKAYSQHIGKPSTYESGPFFKVVVNILEILKLPADDPTRAIRQALKK